MNIDIIIEACHGRRVGSGWMIQCPAHDDRNPSCSISQAGDKLLVHCHAGCRQADVVEALRARGLWLEAERPHGPGRRASGQARRTMGPRKIEATYPYRDETGRVLFEVVRFSPKGFAQRHPNGDGGWTWGAGKRIVLYHLREVIENPIIFIAEGEKDVETLRSWGFVATCNPMGAGKWRDEFNPFFRGKNVFVIPDRDEPGYAHARYVIAALKPYAATVKWIDLEDSKDISEWFEKGHSEVELLILLETFWTRREVTPNGTASS